MTELEIKQQIAACDATLDDINTARDKLTTEARAVSTKRAELAGMLKMLEMPPSPLRAQILKAAGIESGEAFGNG